MKTILQLVTISIIAVILFFIMYSGIPVGEQVYLLLHRFIHNVIYQDINKNITLVVLMSIIECFIGLMGAGFLIAYNNISKLLKRDKFGWYLLPSLIINLVRFFLSGIFIGFGMGGFSRIWVILLEKGLIPF